MAAAFRERKLPVILVKVVGDVNQLDRQRSPRSASENW